MKILLYGGTFDPPHYGHLNNLRAAASRVQPDEIVVMPAGVSPFKQMSATPGALRAEMCGCGILPARRSKTNRGSPSASLPKRLAVTPVPSRYC